MFIKDAIVNINEITLERFMYNAESYNIIIH